MMVCKNCHVRRAQETTSNFWLCKRCFEEAYYDPQAVRERQEQDKRDMDARDTN